MTTPWIADDARAQTNGTAGEVDRGAMSAPVGFGRVGEDFVIRFAGADAARATVRQLDRDLVVTFPGALPRLDAQALQQQVAGWAEGVSIGFDTLALRLTPGTIATWGEDGGRRGLQIRLARRTELEPSGAAAPDAPLSDETARLGEFRLRLLEAQLLARTGRLGEARRSFEALRQDMPDRAEPVAGLAAVARESGRLRQSIALYREALLLAPSDRAVAVALADAERERAPRVRADVEHRIQDGGLGSDRANATIGVISGFQPVGDAWRIGAIVGIAYVSASQLQRANGTVGSFSGVRQSFELYAQYEDVEGVVVVGSVFATAQTFGFGARAQLPDDSGYTTLRAEYHRPNWTFIESIVENGTRDRVVVGRFQRILPGLNGRLELGYNRYNLPDDDGVASSVSVTGELRLVDVAGVRGLSVAYVLDGEYVLDHEQRINVNGQAFRPLPVVNREVHAALVGYSGAEEGAIAEGGRFVYEVSGGYGVDRYGRSGPLVFGSLGYAIGSFEAAIRASYIRNIGRSQGTTTTVGGHLTWYF